MNAEKLKLLGVKNYFYLFLYFISCETTLLLTIF